jgi:preprotein translocase subunit YajC
MNFANLFGLSQQTPAQPTAGGGLFSMLIMMGLVFVIFYFLIIMPSRKKQKKHQEMVEQLKSGDKIVTTGGIYGTVMGVQKDRIEIKVSANTKIEITKSAVGAILTPPAQMETKK